MTMTEGALAPLLTISPDKDTSLAPPDDDPGRAMPLRADAWLPNPDSYTAPTATIRHALRALASESGPGEGLYRVRRLRPLVAQAHDITARTVRIGRLGRGISARPGAACGQRGDRPAAHCIDLQRNAPWQHGRPTRRDCGGRLRTKRTRPRLRPRPALSPSRKQRAGTVAPATQACIGAVVTCLWDFGFVLDHAARSVQECLELARDNPTVLAGLVDRRHLWGCQGLFAALDAELAARFAGPDAGCWRDAVGSALSPTRRHAPRDVYALEDEPDVKRGPGGLRDLQRALWANACASGRSMPLKPSRLVQAHRFLWQVRCHLHLLAGRAEDRLSRSLQPGIARRLGLPDSRGPAARPLLDLFRYHARNIVAAIESAPRSSARLLPNNR